MKNKTGNQVNVIHPYKTGYGYWAFDDPEVELQGEPFIGSVNDMLDRLTNDGTKCTVLFSKDKIPDFDACLEKVQSPDGSPEPGWYKWVSINLSGWLCPALLKYFKEYPDRIYVKIQK